MNREQAIEVLKLQKSFTVDDIRQQYAIQYETLIRKHAQTSSQVIKAKYSEILSQFSQAKTCLLNTTSSNQPFYRVDATSANATTQDTHKNHAFALDHTYSNYQTQTNQQPHSRVQEQQNSTNNETAEFNPLERKKSEFETKTKRAAKIQKIKTRRKLTAEDLCQGGAYQGAATSSQESNSKRAAQHRQRRRTRTHRMSPYSQDNQTFFIPSVFTLVLVLVFSFFWLNKEGLLEPTFRYFVQSIISGDHPHPSYVSTANPFIQETPKAQTLVDQKVHNLQKSIQEKIFNQLKLHLVSIPGGSFYAGCTSGLDCSDDENPLHLVHVSPFKMSQFEITFEQWDACVYDQYCQHRPDDEGWGRGQQPVINVSYQDITTQFIPWLNTFIGSGFRLPTEMEWEYAARAGTDTRYHWGNDIGINQANCGGSGCGSAWDNQQTAPVGSFSANAFGLYDMHGNVLEWTQDCWNDSYNGAPVTQVAWNTGKCSSRVVRGGAWNSLPQHIRSADRNAFRAYKRANYRGFRVVQDTQPKSATTHQTAAKNF